MKNAATGWALQIGTSDWEGANIPYVKASLLFCTELTKVCVAKTSCNQLSLVECAIYLYTHQNQLASYQQCSKDPPQYCANMHHKQRNTIQYDTTGGLQINGILRELCHFIMSLNRSLCTLNLGIIECIGNIIWFTTWSHIMWVPLQLCDWQESNLATL